MAGPAETHDKTSDAAGRNDGTQAEDVRRMFVALKKGLKQIALYRHNTDRYGEYLDPFVSALQTYLARYGMLSLKLDALEYRLGREVVFTDEGRDGNIVFPLWQSGVRMLRFKQGVSLEEIQRFFMICMSQSDENRKNREDVITQLWKSELTFIEYVVVEGFKAAPDDELEEVEVEVEKVVAYLYRQLQSSSSDYLRFARVSSEDLDLKLDAIEQMRGAVIQGVTATASDKARIQQTLIAEESRHLQKMVVVLFQLLELDTAEDNFEDVAEAFVQLLDALILSENFAAIAQMRDRFIVSGQKPTLPANTRALVRRCEERFVLRMGESQRVQAVGHVLNAGVAKDAVGVRKYLSSLGVEAIVPLLDMLEVLQIVPNRRLVCDVLVELGKHHPDTFIQRLNHPSSNMVKDMLYVVDKLNPPNKFSVFSQVLEHPNAILRLETLVVIGRGGTSECFQVISNVIKKHADPQMRNQAARMLPNFPPEKGAALLLDLIRAESFDKATEPEKKALFTALAQLHAPETDAYINEVFSQKSSLFKKKTDDLKLLAIGGIESAPSIQGLQQLVAISQDGRTHSRDVVDTALAAIVTVKSKLMGG